jgi:hypothetical protein
MELSAEQRNATDEQHAHFPKIKAPSFADEWMNDSVLNDTTAQQFQEPSSPHAPKMIVFCGQAIEICDESRENEKLSPDIVKFKWRKEQILARKSNFKSAEISSCPRKITNRISDHYKPQKNCGLPDTICSCHINSKRATEVSTDATEVCRTQNSNNCTHAVWSGWLNLKESGILKSHWPWKQWWCVLNVDRDKLRLDCLVVDASYGSIRTAKSIELDPSSEARMEKPAVICTSCTRLSIRERGSMRRYYLICESPEETERLLASVNALLGSLSSCEPSEADY